MAYVTFANLNRIVKKVDLSLFNGDRNDVYHEDIYFLSDTEIKRLLSFKKLVKDPEKFYIEYYTKFDKDRSDNLVYVYADNSHGSYHNDKLCGRLNSSYKNIRIPEELRRRWHDDGGEEKLKNEVERFRTWFKEHKEEYDNDLEKFLKSLEVRYNVIVKPEEVEVTNSGFTELANYELSDLEERINEFIRASKRYYTDNPSDQVLIRKFQKLTFLAYTEEPIRINDTGFTDDEVKDFLRMYDERFKKPVKELLRQYYMMKYNPTLHFEGRLLEQLGLTACRACAEASINEPELERRANVFPHPLSFELAEPSYEDYEFIDIEKDKRRYEKIYLESTYYRDAG